MPYDNKERRILKNVSKQMRWETGAFICIPHDGKNEDVKMSTVLDFQIVFSFYFYKKLRTLVSSVEKGKDNKIENFSSRMRASVYG